jgi:hypothetical protein
VFDNLDPFLTCDDTSQLLFPLPNCCTGAGIKLPPGTVVSVLQPVSSTPISKIRDTARQTKSAVMGAANGASVVGAVFGTLFIIVSSAVVVILLILLYFRRHRERKRAMMRDIMAE